MIQNTIENEVKDPTIFIIDDEEIVTDIIRMYLEEAGYQNLHVFNNSVEAMESLSLIKVDLIITDLNMPELGGKFLTKLVRQTSHLESSFILVVTSEDSPAVHEQIKLNGVDSILLKPVDFDSLQAEVDRLMEQREREMVARNGTHQSVSLKKKEQQLRNAFNRG